MSLTFRMSFSDEMLKLAGADAECGKCGKSGQPGPGGACPNCGGHMKVVQEDAEKQKQETREGEESGE